MRAIDKLKQLLHFAGNGGVWRCNWQSGLLPRIFVFTMVLIILAALTITASYLFCLKPELVTYQSYSRAFFDRNDALMRMTLAADQRYRIYTPIDEVSNTFRDASILYEDKNFYSHAGVDLPAIIRAFWSTYVSRERRIGASTITMQVARLRWRIDTTRISGKLRQIIRALQLTRHYGKNQILEAYFNLASYGRNIEGVGAASLIYFNKPASALSLPEALALAVIPQNPNRRNPSVEKGRLALYAARSHLYQRWLQDHPEDAFQSAFMTMPLAVRPPEALPFIAPHFVDQLNASLPWLESGIIKTSIDKNQQKLAEKVLSAYVQRRKSERINNAAAMLLNYKTMEVEALVGSADFFDQKINGQVNGVSAKRSPGSALKPFVYALALDQGVIHPMTMLKDSKKRFGGFTPENYDQQFLGPVFARDALITSRNVPAVDLQSQLPGMSFYQFLKKAQVSGLKEEAHYGLALALGGGELTMQEIVRLYAMLANGGRLKAIKSLRDEQPQQSIDKTDSEQLLSPEASFLILDILKDNPAPFVKESIGSVNRRNHIAWKTGTSFAFRDAWAVGISGPYVLAVWVGDFQGSGNPAFIGRKAAGPLLFELFAVLQANEDWRVDDAVDPAKLNLSKISVCANTGDLPGRYCPQTKPAWFIPGVSPIKVSTVHRAIPIDKQTGLRACWHQSGETELKVYEFWPSDFLNIFQAAGISLRTPPAYAKACTLNAISSTGQEPLIKSPLPGITYALQSDKETQDAIPLSAVVDADVKELFWFIGSEFVGKSRKNQPLFWRPHDGEFNVRVVDDHGRAAQSAFKVSFVR